MMKESTIYWAEEKAENPGRIPPCHWGCYRHPTSKKNGTCISLQQAINLIYLSSFVAIFLRHFLFVKYRLLCSMSRMDVCVKFRHFKPPPSPLLLSAHRLHEHPRRCQRLNEQSCNHDQLADHPAGQGRGRGEVFLSRRGISHAVQHQSARHTR